MSALYGDVFNSDPFKMIELTDRINRTPYNPQFLGSMNLFKQVPVSTTTVGSEDLTFTAALVQTSPIGSPPPIYLAPKRKMRPFNTVRIAERTSLLSKEVQNVRAGAGVIINGQSVELQNAMSLIDGKLTQMRDARIETTLEYHRITALQGTLLDADGSTIYNYATEYGLSQTSVNFVFGTSTTEMANKCHAVTNAIRASLGSAHNASIKYIGLCGATFFDSLTSHATTKAAYANRVVVNPSVDPLIQNLYVQGFLFQDILWYVPYVTTVAGTSFIAATEAWVFPYGVDGMFVDVCAPADYMETVNTMGLPMYSKMVPDPSGYNRSLEVEIQAQRLLINTRPDAVVKCTSS